MDVNEQVLWPISLFSGIIMCKIVYEITGYLSALHFAGYAKLGKVEKIEWNNRGFSSFHAIVVAAVSFYLLVMSEIFRDDFSEEFITKRRSSLSDCIFGISIGYFVSDLAMIVWLFPALGGKEYILHHCVSLYSICLALVSGYVHLYILMVLFSEITTPFVNLRWYLDRAGRKNSKLYLYNGVALFLGWLVARVLLFIYFFAHIYLHFSQVKTMFSLGFYSLLVGPSILALMNTYWLLKIIKGLIKTISRSKHGDHIQ